MRVSYIHRVLSTHPRIHRRLCTGRRSDIPTENASNPYPAKTNTTTTTLWLWYSKSTSCDGIYPPSREPSIVPTCVLQNLLVVVVSHLVLRFHATDFLPRSSVCVVVKALCIFRHERGWRSGLTSRVVYWCLSCPFTLIACRSLPSPCTDSIPCHHRR